MYPIAQHVAKRNAGYDLNFDFPPLCGGGVCRDKNSYSAPRGAQNKMRFVTQHSVR